MRLPFQLSLVIPSAILVPLCFPPFGCWPLVLLIFPLLLFATTNTTPRRAFYLGILHGLIGYGSSLYWLYHIFTVAAFPLYAILALFTALFCLLHTCFVQHTPSVILRIILAATLWTGIEFFRSELYFLRFPWITPGSALGPTYLSPILGVYGASFLVMAASSAFLQRRTFPVAILLSLGVISLGLFRPGRVEPVDAGALTVTVVQSEDCILDSYVTLTKAARNESPHLIVWPEYSLPYDVRQNEIDFATLANLCAEMDAILVVGTKTVIGSGDKDWYNTALILNKDGVLGEYYKARPVHFFNDGIPGRRFTPVRTHMGTFGTPICFDGDYSEVTRKIVTLGAEYFAVPIFDAQSWSAHQHVQHALLFRLRAAENARWFACAASSGVSQIIDPHGHVHGSLPPMETGTLTYRINRRGDLTVFAQVGWLFPWLTFGGSIILLVYGGFTLNFSRKRAESGSNQPTLLRQREF